MQIVKSFNDCLFVNRVGLISEPKLNWTNSLHTAATSLSVLQVTGGSTVTCSTDLFSNDLDGFSFTVFEFNGLPSDDTLIKF